MSRIFRFIVIFSISIGAAQEIKLNNTSAILQKGEFEVGLFQPLRYGLRETIEISFHPLAALVIPNFTLKKKLNTINNYSLIS